MALTPSFSSQIQPLGWLKDVMNHDLTKGFVGHLDRLVPELIIDDDIYHQHRLTNAVKSKDLGTADTDAEWQVQFLWWNSETQSNWWDGYVRHAFLVGDQSHKQKVETYIARILASQDDDGYLGVYAPDLRFQATGENGELWAQATLLRTLLAYYEFTQSQTVFDAVVRSVALTMHTWPINLCHPFKLEKPYAGACHGLMYCDVLRQLHRHTGEQHYLDYAEFLYSDYCQFQLSEQDIQWQHLIDSSYRFQGHGVHTWEQPRALLTALRASGNLKYKQALEAFIARIERYTTPSGGPIGDEFILGNHADATFTGYEYCSIHEWLDSLIEIALYFDDLSWFDKVETLLFNAGFGARHPDNMGIAYLKTDNSYSMEGDAGCHCRSNNPHEVQTRYKYSPTHQEAAVCCVPNVGRILPYYLKAMWMQREDKIVKTLYGASEYRTNVQGVEVTLLETGNYPAELNTTIEMLASGDVDTHLLLRIPSWADEVLINRTPAMVNNHLVELPLKGTDAKFEIEFVTAPVKHLCERGSKSDASEFGVDTYFSYGPLIYARQIDHHQQVEKTFLDGQFSDRLYKAVELYHPYRLPQDHQIELSTVRYSTFAGTAQGLTLNEVINLRPMAGTILRQVTFSSE